MSKSHGENATELSFGRLEDTLGFLLLAGWRHASRDFGKYFNGVDITPDAYGVLILVDQNPGCAVGDVGRAMGITPNNIARLVDRLCERDLLAKTVGPDDARIRSLTITRSGAEFLERLNARHAAYENDFEKQIGRDRMDALRALLRPFMKSGGLVD